MTDFDDLGSDYRKILNKEIDFSGDGMEHFSDYKAQCVVSYLGDDFNGKILDYGCGIGLMVKYIADRLDRTRAEVFGFDVSKELLKDALRNAKEAKFFGYFQDIPKEYFDVVVMANVLHHVKPEDRILFIEDAKSVLKKNGRIFIFEHNPYNPMTRLVVKRSALDKGVELISIRGMNRLFRGAGIKNIHKRFIVFFPRILSFLRPIEPMMGFIPLGAQYFYVGENR